MRDNSFKLEEDNGAIVIKATRAGMVDNEAQIVDVGSGRVSGEFVVDLSQIEVASNDEKYEIKLQGSTSSTFASGIVDLANITVGAKEVIGDDADSAAGRYKAPFMNEKPAGTVYRYLRAYFVVSGTVANGIAAKAWVVPGPTQSHVTDISTTSLVATTTTAAG